ncbi:serine hydrolase domain-containing protein [Flavobacterium sediminis]|uniref:serine hydrolase domain-containing protein n=1 Tax=Flavobacterium sediminis TaxID=2201181 RepID=UPI0021CECB16|nr:serine hydrolase [Flavobacterium sediminis]
MKKLIFLIALSFSIIVSGQDRFEKMDQYLTYLYENNKFMGSLCIREGENVVFSKAYGFSDVENKITADRLTTYKIGSISKTFTAVMIMQLIEEKKLRLESKLTKFFPKVKKADSISVADLLYQRTGIPDFVNHDSITSKELKTLNLKEAIYQKIAKYDSRFNPGSQFEYSNSNYFLLGGIIEKITKKSFAENLEERIVKKADLKSTYYKPDTTDTRNKESYSYSYDGEWKLYPNGTTTLPSLPVELFQTLPT